MACSKHVFPEEMTMEILKRAPLKLLIRCRSVCKSWLSIIADPEFIKTHFQYQQYMTDKEASLLMIVESYLPLPPLVSPDFKCYLYVPHKFTVIGSCHGIICLVDDIHCYLWNPLTKQCKQLPTFPRNQKPIVNVHHAGNIAFCFDTISNDYKVLRLLCELLTTGGLPVLQLYSTNTNSWQEIYINDTSPSKVLCYPYLKLGPVINGVIYTGRKEYAVSFNMHTEVCTAIPIPSSMVRYSDILDFEGSAAVICGSASRGSELSLLTLDNVDGKISWTKMFNIIQDGMGWIYSCLGGGLLYGRKRGDVTEYFLYDYRNKDFKYMPLSNSPVRTFLKYTETVASVKGLSHDLYEFNKTVSLL
ncbi:putative F-box protein At4g38870 [Daucus carota subsp. sativus]|uniref:putative F-box protein At4g38870 n=1 Tax=Daucus carota subsp. sativus TaxID=79200 RepID=UPI0007EFD380|nr:PREDICTED: putative F-box protein At4g38870 [Daucus carota subsp. sativus]